MLLNNDISKAKEISETEFDERKVPEIQLFHLETICRGEFCLAIEFTYAIDAQNNMAMSYGRAEWYGGAE